MGLCLVIVECLEKLLCDAAGIPYDTKASSWRHDGVSLEYEKVVWIERGLEDGGVLPHFIVQECSGSRHVRVDAADRLRM